MNKKYKEMEATNERQIEIIEYIENWYHSSEIPAGKACNQIPTIFKSKNGVARKWFSEPLCSIM